MFQAKNRLRERKKRKGDTEKRGAAEKNGARVAWTKNKGISFNWN